jgi:hypothetical protein
VDVSRRRVVVTIDEVRLHGFEPRHGSSIGDALRDELERVLGVPASSKLAGDRAHIDAGTFGTNREATPRAVGKRIATAVGRGLRTPC